MIVVNLTKNRRFILKNTTIQEWMKIEKKLSLKKVNSTNFEEIQRLLAEQLTIGKMIEILEAKFDSEKYEVLSITRKAKEQNITSYSYDNGEWEVLVTDYSNYARIILTKSSAELCDALWEAVKDVIEREDKQ